MSAHGWDLSGRSALVVGGSGGIGSAIARNLAASGASVGITHRSALDYTRPVETLCDELALDGRRFDPIHLDIRDVSAIGEAVGRFAQQVDGVDILVNSAGTNIEQDALAVDERTWDSILDTNLKGLFFSCQATARDIAARPPAQKGAFSFVNVASQMGVVGYARRAAYCSSKAGVVNLTRVLAIEWARLGIRVNAVAPTFIETPLAKPMLVDPEFRAEVLSRSPMHEIGEPDDVAQAVLYLAAPASRLVTGHTLAVDGGWTAW